MPNSDDVLIKVENVSKKFCRSLKRSMLYGMEDISRDLLHLPNTSDKLRKDEFWAVDDVSFEVKRGECLGIIGRNGAGKSTLLKMLNGIILPDKGKISIKGKVGALIEVGAGFHPMLTGRENVYVNGAILGMSKREIDKKFDEIVAFAELEESIDMPVKHYSSGMYARLGFSIAAHCNPDIFLIDEVLAVGDINFRAKCFRRMTELRKEGTSILFVSHEMSLIDKISTQVLLLRKYLPAFIGSSNSSINQLHQDFLLIKNQGKTLNSESFSISNVKIQSDSGELEPGKDLRVEIYYKCDIKTFTYPSVAFHIGYGEQIAACRSDKDNLGLIQLSPPGGMLALKIPKNPLQPGIYTVSIRMFDTDKITPLVEHYMAYKFIINGGCDVVGYIYFDYCWDLNDV
ncbi:hypothetical protein A1359_10440 [Methylomonas lenta]|uniref:ABC transporter domain-containing protein n=1 Tax=Methylomonas lenta TaxID=980561 RepID=A0A177N9B8_9GAMM|nr:ABC transporter ATP-binding protein [Methylomonas lenta]OAI14485.1 hypothetical protein A1359_10440 [Methylomonas lenta]